MNVPFHKVDCGGNELEYLKEVLESGWLTTSRFAHRLEAAFIEATGARFAIAVNDDGSPPAARFGIDDIALVVGIFFDGFESGDTSRWSSMTP